MARDLGLWTFGGVAPAVVSLARFHSLRCSCEDETGRDSLALLKMLGDNAYLLSKVLRFTV
jgi:hypothetical protein